MQNQALNIPTLDLYGINMDLCLKNKVAVITGVNNPIGIGATTALALADEGVKVVMVHKPVISDYNPQKAEILGMDRYKSIIAGDAGDVERAMQLKGTPYALIEADISNEDDVKRIFDVAEAKLGPVDILINNAGVFAEEDNIMTASKKEMHAVYRVNVEGTLYMMREFVLRYHERQGVSGRIINLSTDATEFFASQVIYGSSKAAVEAMTRGVSLEIAHLGITVNAVAPGPVQTGWLDRVSEKLILPTIPMGRVGLPEDVTGAILFLASEKASWLTGQIIKVAGGHSI